MANDDAWQAGIDIAQNHKDNKKSKGNKGKKNTTDNAKSSAGGGNPWSILSLIPKKHKGGKVKKTGPYILKKGEHVITAKQAKTYHRKNLGTKATKKRVTKR